MLLTFFFTETDTPVNLVLPNKWLWDIVDEFIYQVRIVESIELRLIKR